MPPIRLSDSELDAVMAAARPLPVERRDAFLQAVAAELRGREVGPGIVQVSAPKHSGRSSTHRSLQRVRLAAGRSIADGLASRVELARFGRTTP